MILLVDSGTSKCDWVFVDKKQHEKHFDIRTQGINPSYHTENEILGIINNHNDFLAVKSHVEKIYFFGAGCGTEAAVKKMEEILRKFFFNSKLIHVTGDIEGAVYSCVEGNAVVCILGTGSNSCYYDGDQIQLRVPSLGYSVMDDGGGSQIGRDCLRAYFYNKMSPALKADFEARFNPDITQIREQLYHGRDRSQFLAGFARFVVEHKDNELMQSILRHQIRAFFDNHVEMYKHELENDPIFFVGAMAYHNKEIIELLCNEKGFNLVQCIERPILAMAERVDDIEKYF